MKKVLKFGVVLTALVFGLVCLAACSDGGGSNDGGGSVNNNGGGITNNGGGNSNNGNTNDDEAETPKRTVVAEWQEENSSPMVYLFYSDGTYEYKESQQLMEKGLYYGSPTKRGSVTMQRQSFFDNNAGKLIPDAKKYTITIFKDDDDLYFEDDAGNYYFLNN